MQKKFEKSVIWLMIVLLTICEPIQLFQSRPVRADEPFFQLNVDNLLTDVEKAVEEFKVSLGALALSDDPQVKRKAYEVAAVLHELLPNDYGIMETTAAINGTEILTVSSEEWAKNGKSIVQEYALAGKFDEIMPYAFDETSQPLDENGFGPMQSNSLSYDSQKPAQLNFDGLKNESAVTALALVNPRMAFSVASSGGLFSRFFGGGGGNAGNQECGSCGPRNYQCNTGNPYQQQYAPNGCTSCSSSGQFSPSGTQSRGGMMSSGGNGRRWYNPNYNGGGQTTFGATCCDRPYYDVGLGGGRNSRFSDVKGIGLRQSFQRYVGPKFGEGRLLNFFVNPTCVQRARRRLLIVIGITAATAGGGGAAAPILFLQNDVQQNPFEHYCDTNAMRKSWNWIDDYQLSA